MSSSRIVLIFIGFILIIIIALTSAKISGFLRDRFGKYIPVPKITNEKITPTPTIIPVTLTPTASPKPTVISRNGSSTPSNQTPATGPEDLVWVLIGGSLVLGITLKKLSPTS